MRTFHEDVTEDFLKSLMPKRVGLRLFADAVRSNLATAELRELWKVLESAFRATDDRLVKLLAAYPPAQALEFKEEELKAMLVLQRRASHAQSSKAIEELRRVENECAERTPRLKNLCERVILTKKPWGYPTSGTEEILPLHGFVKNS